jgi:hypothetical protein
VTYRLLLALALTACSERAIQCEVDSHCFEGERCLDSLCVVILVDAGRTTDAGKPDAGNDAGGTDGGVDAGMPDAGMHDAGCDDPPPPADRAMATACTSCRPTGPDPGPGFGDGCEAHSECTAGMNGRCVLAMIGSLCDYDECFVDSDCEANEVCSCDGSYYGGNHCVPGNCRVNADCMSGLCSPSYGCLSGGPPEGWYCKTAADECADDADCNDPMTAGGRCAYDTTRMSWRCEYGICVF